MSFFKKKSNREKNSILTPDEKYLLNELINIYIDQNKLDDAKSLCERLIEINLPDASTYNRLGFIYKRQNNLLKACENYKIAIELNPNFYIGYCNLGKTLYELDNLNEAKKVYLRAIKIDQNEFLAYFGLAIIYQEEDNLDQAKMYYQKVIELNPNYPESYLNLAHLLESQALFEQSIIAFKKLIDLNYNLEETYASLAAVQKQIGFIQEAISNYQHAFELGNKKAFYQLEILKNKKISSLPLKDIIESFDKYADHYEIALYKILKSKIPSLLFQAIQTVCGVQHRFKSILDLGCGTGFIGTIFRNKSDCLVGIDISTNMIEQAQQKKVYDQLYHDDIIHCLKNLNDEYDLIIAADVFVYFGELETFFASVNHIISRCGYFAFSIEHTKIEPYFLNVSGRFAHSNSYIQSLIQQYHFSNEYDYSTHIRKEYGAWIRGDIYVLQKTF